MIKKRLAALRMLLKSKELDGILVTLPANRRYLSGFTAEDGQFGESSGALLITASDAFIFTDMRYELSAREQAKYFNCRIYARGLAWELAHLAPELRLKKLAFEAEGLLVEQKAKLEQALEGCEFIPTLGMVSFLRRRKEPGEVRSIEAALVLIESVLGEILAQDVTGMTERELALKITRASEDLGAEGPAFDPIVAAGPNGAEPHAVPGDRVIKEGEPVLFDVGARLKGYNSDISRTVAAGGWEKAGDLFKEVYATVRKAQVAAIDSIFCGMTGKQADSIARQVITEAGYGDKFGHSLGHGVGIMVHEFPSVGPNSPDLLLPGMIFTVEPGIYIPGWGGVRLEQMVEMTEQGCRLLNNLDCFYDID